MASKIIEGWLREDFGELVAHEILEKLAGKAAALSVRCFAKHPHRPWLECELDRGHNEMHRNERMGVEWTEGAAWVVRTYHDDLGPIQLLTAGDEPTPDDPDAGSVGADDPWDEPQGPVHGYAAVIEALTMSLTTHQSIVQAYRVKRFNVTHARSASAAAEKCQAALDTLHKVNNS